MGRIAFVTGANQGLGFALVKGLAHRLSAEDTVYLTARSKERGREALTALGKTKATALFHGLDVTDPSSIQAFAAHLKEQHGGVDLVISNAAARMAKNIPQAQQVRGFIATNNHGSRDLLDAMLPLLRDNARYLMVASSFGQLSRLPANLHPMFDTDTATLADIEATMDAFVDALEEGRAQAEGWPDWINIPSKIGQVATARVAARDIMAARPESGILINAACPGLIDTAASRPWFDDMSNARSPDDAAQPVIDTLLTPKGATGPQGELVRFGQALPWL